MNFSKYRTRRPLCKLHLHMQDLGIDVSQGSQATLQFLIGTSLATRDSHRWLLTPCYTAVLHQLDLHFPEL